MADGRVRIVVVEDDDDFRAALRQLLTAAEYDVTVFASAEEFLKRSASVVAHCVMLDIHLPGMNGVELHRLLSSSRGMIPVVFMTGRDDAATRALMQLAPQAPYLRKPFGEDELLDAIRCAMAR